MGQELSTGQGSRAPATPPSPGLSSHLWNRVLRVRLSPGHSCSSLSWSFRSLCLSHTLTSPSYAVAPIRYSLSSSLLPLVSFLLLCPFPDSPPRPTFLHSGSLSSLSCSLLSLSLSVYLYLSPPPLPPASNRSPLYPEALRVAAEIYSSPPPTHAQLGRSSHCSATLPSHHPSIHNHSQAISFCCPLTHHGSQGSSRVGLRSPALSTHPERLFHSQPHSWVGVENGDKGLGWAGGVQLSLATGQRPSRNVVKDWGPACS